MTPACHTRLTLWTRPPMPPARLLVGADARTGARAGAAAVSVGWVETQPAAAAGRRACSPRSYQLQLWLACGGAGHPDRVMRSERRTGQALPPVRLEGRLASPGSIADLHRITRVIHPRHVISTRPRFHRRIIRVIGRPLLDARHARMRPLDNGPRQMLDCS